MVVGLGNPGPTYAGNRHNIGAMAVTAWAAEHGQTLRSHRTRCLVAQLRLRAQPPAPGTPAPPAPGTLTPGNPAPGNPAPGHLAAAPAPSVPIAVIVAQPTTYMNEAGGPVRALTQYFSVNISRLIVVHDELDVDFGSLRVKRGGGAGGHNGLRSVSASLGSQDYLRIRVGIGRPPGRMAPADFVLKDFSQTEQRDLPALFADVQDALVAQITTQAPSD